MKPVVGPEKGKISHIWSYCCVIVVVTHNEAVILTYLYRNIIIQCACIQAQFCLTSIAFYTM